MSLLPSQLLRVRFAPPCIHLSQVRCPPLSPCCPTCLDGCNALHPLQAPLRPHLIQRRAGLLGQQPQLLVHAVAHTQVLWRRLVREHTVLLCALGLRGHKGRDNAGQHMCPCVDGRARPSSEPTGPDVRLHPVHSSRCHTTRPYLTRSLPLLPVVVSQANTAPAHHRHAHTPCALNRPTSSWARKSSSRSRSSGAAASSSCCRAPSSRTVPARCACGAHGAAGRVRVTRMTVRRGGATGATRRRLFPLQASIPAPSHRASSIGPTPAALPPLGPYRPAIQNTARFTPGPLSTDTSPAPANEPPGPSPPARQPRRHLQLA